MTILPRLRNIMGKIPIYIDGEFKESETDNWMDVMNPAKDVAKAAEYISMEAADLFREFSRRLEHISLIYKPNIFTYFKLYILTLQP